MERFKANFPNIAIPETKTVMTCKISIADITGFTNVYVSLQSQTSWPNNETNAHKSEQSNSMSNTQTITITNASTDTYHIATH